MPKPDKIKDPFYIGLQEKNSLERATIERSIMARLLLVHII